MIKFTDEDVGGVDVVGVVGVGGAVVVIVVRVGVPALVVVFVIGVAAVGVMVTTPVILAAVKALDMDVEVKAVMGWRRSRNNGGGRRR